jgi:hypothetical protein
MQDHRSQCKAARDARLVLKIAPRRCRKRSPRAEAQAAGHPQRRRAVAKADAALLAALQEVPHLFKRPKSVVFHGLQVGYKKGSGSIEIDDAAHVVKLVRKHFPDKFDELVKVKETPIKAAIRNLTGAELQKLGITAQSTGEVVFIQAWRRQSTTVDKLVKALLNGRRVAEQEAEEVRPNGMRCRSAPPTSRKAGHVRQSQRLRTRRGSRPHVPVRLRVVGLPERAAIDQGTRSGPPWGALGPWGLAVSAPASATATCTGSCQPKTSAASGGLSRGQVLAGSPGNRALVKALS